MFQFHAAPSPAIVIPMTAMRNPITNLCILVGSDIGL